MSERLTDEELTEMSGRWPRCCYSTTCKDNMVHLAIAELRQRRAAESLACELSEEERAALTITRDRVSRVWKESRRREPDEFGAERWNQDLDAIKVTVRFLDKLLARGKGGGAP